MEKYTRDISSRGKEWNSTQAIFKLVVTKILLKLKDKYLQMETALWVLNNIKKYFPSLMHIIEKLMNIKGKKSIRDINLFLINGKS